MTLGPAACVAPPPLAPGDAGNGILAAVDASRRLAACLLALGALALALPAVTLAAGGGGSAGDQQYTDPFGATSTPTHASAPPPTTTAAPTPPPAATPTTTSAPAPVATGTVTSDATTSSAEPTATTASSAPASGAGQLPYTGYDSWLAGALGLGLIAGGVVLRWRVSRS